MDIHSICITGPSSTIYAGNCSTIVAGNQSTIQTENSSIAITGTLGRVRCGYNGIAIAGYQGTACGDTGSILVIKHTGDKSKIAIVGENGIKPDTVYRLDIDGNFVEADNK